MTYLVRDKRARKGLLRPAVSVLKREGVSETGKGAIPATGGPWLLPRVPEDHALIKAIGSNARNLRYIGYRPQVGLYVWNRDRRRQYRTWKAAREQGVAPFPVIWSSHIGKDLRLRYPLRAARWRGALIVEMGTKTHPGS